MRELQSDNVMVRDAHSIGEELEREVLRLLGPRQELFFKDDDFGHWENASCPDEEADECESSAVDPEDTPSVDGSPGTCPPVLTMAGGVESDEQGSEAIPKPKPEEEGSFRPS